MRTFQLLVLLAAALALGGCYNMVISDEPVLAAADAVPEWTVKPGLWTTGSTRDAKCPFEPARSVRNWPDCAEFWFVEETPFSKAFGNQLDETDWIMAEVDPGLFVMQAGSRDPDPDFNFHFFTREKQDPAGAATRIGYGWLFCGPPPPDGATWPDGQGRGLTLKPYPGAILGHDNCWPDGKEGLFALTRANRAAGTLATLQWRRAARADEIALLQRRKAREQAAEAARLKREAAQSTIAE